MEASYPQGMCDLVNHRGCIVQKQGCRQGQGQSLGRERFNEGGATKENAQIAVEDGEEEKGEGRLGVCVGVGVGGCLCLRLCVCFVCVCARAGMCE